MGRILSIAAKDVKIWVRDIAALGILLGMPVILILILGSALGGLGSDGGEIRVPVVIANLDTGADGPIPGAPPTSSQGMRFDHGKEVVDVFEETESLRDLFEVTVSDDPDAALQAVREGQAAALLVIPRDFTQRMQAGEPVVLQVHTDPGQQMGAGVLTSVVKSLAARYSAASVSVQTALAVANEQAPQMASSPAGQAVYGVAIQEATRDDTDHGVRVNETQASVLKLRALDFYGLSMSGMFLMFGSMFGAFSIIKERREQTMSRMLSTPTAAWQVTAGKMSGVFLLGMLQFAVLYVFTRFVFGVQWGNDPIGTWAIAAAEVLAVTGLAALIASLTTTERGAGGLGPLVIQVQALIGGAFFTISVLPEWIQPIRFASVIGWATEGWSAIQSGTATTPDVVYPVAALVGIGVMLFGIAAWRTGVRR